MEHSQLMLWAWQLLKGHSALLVLRFHSHTESAREKLPAALAQSISDVSPSDWDGFYKWSPRVGDPTGCPWDYRKLYFD